MCIAPGGYPTYTAAALRFVLAAVILGAIVAFGGARPLPRGRRAWTWLVIAGLFNFAGYALVYTAEESIPGALGAVTYGTAPLITAVVAALTGTERATRAAVAGALVGLAGIALIFWDRLNVSSSQAAGVAMVLASVLLSSGYNVILKRQATGQHPLATNMVFLGTTALAMSALALGHGERMPWPPPPGPSLAVLYLAVVGSVVAFASYFYLLQRTKLMTSSTLVLWPPIVALVVDAIWESQKVAPLTYVGAAVTLAGVGMNLFLGKRG